MYSPADQDPNEELKRVARVLGASISRTASAFHGMASRLTSVACDLSNAMAEFDREVQRAIRDDDGDDGDKVGTKQ